ncbi:hypothetical protein ACLN1Y_06505 [Apilactobacillus kunkeei]|uniref:hypothetical protein n=1 Tax=Apilactobacillus kunkeei TaxID=148814 RepID=UPI0039E0D6F4
MTFLKSLFKFLGSAGVTIALIGLLYQVFRDIWKGYPHYKLSIRGHKILEKYTSSKPTIVNDIVIRNTGNRTILLNSIGYITREKTVNSFFDHPEYSRELNNELKPNDIFHTTLREPDDKILYIVIIDGENRVYRNKNIKEGASGRQLNKVRPLSRKTYVINFILFLRNLLKRQ